MSAKRSADIPVRDSKNKRGVSRDGETHSFAGLSAEARRAEEEASAEAGTVTRKKPCSRWQRVGKDWTLRWSVTIQIRGLSQHAQRDLSAFQQSELRELIAS